MWRAGLAVVVIGVLLTGCLASGAGRGENKVMVYTPFPKKTADEWAAAFTARTGIKVEQIKEGTTRVYSRIRAERSNPRCDVWIGGGGMVPFITAAREGLLEPYKPAGWDELGWTSDPSKDGLIVRDPDWHWVGSAIIGLGFVYNPQVLSEDQVPRTWDELADPRWRGDLMMWDPASSGTAMLFLAAALQRSIARTGDEEAGWAWLRSFNANIKRYPEEDPWLLVSRREIKIGVHFEHQVLKGLPENETEARRVLETVRWTLPPDSPVIVDPICLIKNAPHPENAKKFIDFVMGPEGQRIINRYFVVMDRRMQPPPHLEWTLDQMLERSARLDSVWMGNSFNRIRVRWQNDIEKSLFLWEDPATGEVSP